MRRWIVVTTATLALASLAAERTEGVEPTTGLFQVIINVKDMAKEARFWRDAMGFSIVYPSDTSNLAEETFVRFATGGAFLVLHAGRENPNARDGPHHK